MTTNGQPKPGQRVTLPSGAVWEGGRIEGTSTITLPGRGAVLVDPGRGDRANAIVGDPTRIDAVAHAFAAAFGSVPKLFEQWVAAVAPPNGGENDVVSETRVVRVSSKATFRNPAGDRRKGSRGGPDTPETERLRDDTDAGLPEPVRRANGGRVAGPGGPRDDAILARLSDGEYVVNAAATANALPLLEAINAGWVPSPAFLDGMLPGFASGGLVGDAVSDTQRWRDLLAGGLTPPSKPAGDSRWQDMGVFGLAADALDGIANAAMDAGGRAGAAVGSAVAPMFGPGGLLSSLLGTPGPAQTELFGTQPDGTGGPNPLMAALRIDPAGFLGASGPLAGLFGGSGTSGLRNEFDLLGSLSKALGTGIVDAASEAGGEVGAALGAAIAPALGPAGVLAPQIGAELGRMVGSKFGGSLSAAMTLRGEVGGPQTAESGAAPEPGKVLERPDGQQQSLLRSTPAATQQNTIVAENGSGEQSSGSGWRVIWDGDGSSGGIPLENFLTALQSDSAQQGNPAHQGNPAPNQPSTSTPGLSSLALKSTEFTATPGDLTSLGTVAGARLGSGIGEALAPALGASGGPAILGSQIGGAAGSWLGTVAAALAPVLDPTGQWAATLEGQLGGDLGATLYGALAEQQTPGGSQQQNPFVLNQEDVGLNALSGAISGGAQGGLFGAIRGGLTGAASSVGSQIGAAIGTAVAPGVGTAIGGMLGSALGQMGAETVLKPVEQVIGLASGTTKEVIGSGFGLVDLAKGPGGRTAKGDIYNFNGMDPKSAAIAVERVRRRRTLAQQRGGGLGR
ncbi:hypothetical protein ABZ540_23655 [Nocardia xishanensis]|uniref:hypothetical protein n=1 Tax=Nocardia xishanensis TaxID=238964 RepID=UPI0034026930